QVRHYRRAIDLKTIDGLLQRAVGMGHPFMLPQMLDPGIQHERLDEPALACGILEYSPIECAVPAALVRELRDRIQKHGAILRPDPIFDCDEDRPSVRLDVS